MNNSTAQNQQDQELYCVYLHTCTINGKGYIGQTVEGIHKRLNRHMLDVKSGSNFHFHKALRLYGKESFTSYILYVSLEKDSKHLEEVEVQLIADYDTFNNGYNMTSGGGGVGSGKDHPLFGIERPQEIKDRISAKLKGQKKSPEACANMSGKERTPKHCAKISANKMGNQNCLGKQNNLDHTVYNFEHKDGETFEGIQYELRMKYNLDSGHLCKVIHGTSKTHKGWSLVSKEE